MTRPFVEDNLFEQGELTDEFYTAGSSPTVGKDTWTFAKPLRDKEIIRLSFEVTSSTSMLPNSSSIYYFNKKNKTWELPEKALGLFTSPFRQFAVQTGLNDTSKNPGSLFIEDAIMFDSAGRSLVSGSLPIYRAVSSNSTVQKSIDFGFDTYWYDYTSESAKLLNFDRQGELLTGDYQKSCQRSDSFEASLNQTFTIPIEYPFLLEKITVEIPFTFGKSWFRDKTNLSFLTSSLGDYQLNGVGSMGNSIQEFKVVDQGGPALTFALMSQKNYGTGYVRDLICKSLITHEEDIFDPSNVSLKRFFHHDNLMDSYYISTPGIQTGSFDAIVSPTQTQGTNKYFTGSILLKSIASSTNGNKILNIGVTTDYNTNYKNFEFFLDKKLREMFLNPRLTTYEIQVINNPPFPPQTLFYPQDGYQYDEQYCLSGIDTFGRGVTGFSPSGGSIFGGEFSSIDTNKILQDERVKNSFYIEDDVTRSSVFNALSSSLIFNRTKPLTLFSLSDIFLGSEKPSPYLINPGEQLVLTMSKTRPTYSSFKVNVDTSIPNAVSHGIGTVISSSYSYDLDDSIGHDVQLSTGSINITLYGSYVRAGNSYVP